MDNYLTQMLALLTPIAIHSRDIITTKKIICLCKHVFQDVDIWKLKFGYEFPHVNFLECWSAYENYVVQKINNFALLYASSDQLVDNMLYEYSPIYNRFFDFIDGAIHYGSGSSNGQFVKFEIKDRIVVFEDIDYAGYTLMGYHKTMEDAEASIKIRHETSKLQTNRDIDYMIVDLAGTNLFLIGDKMIRENKPTSKPADKWYKFLTLE
jgi:hypothetical protein